MIIIIFLNRDLSNPSQYIVGLALCTIADIASECIARDLSSDIVKLMQNSSPYIRKKATLASLRVIRKCPDMCDIYVERAKKIFTSEKNHGVLLAGTSLVAELVKLKPECSKELALGTVPYMVKVLKNLLTVNYGSDYLYNGYSDPFLQIKLLRGLKLLGGDFLKYGDVKTGEQLKGLLTQIATNTEGARNVGHAILYECVQAIVAIGPASGLMTLAINILGKFLTRRDNNIRYVALNTLQAAVITAEGGPQAIQRHRKTVVDCLKDPDISIRRRALDLVYSLVDESSVKQLTRELMAYLDVADQEFRASIVAKLCWLVERYAPNKRWQLDTTLRIIAAGGNGVVIPDDVPAAICAVMSQTPALQGYAVQRLYAALVRDLSVPDLVKIGLWAIGEFGDLLCTPANLPAELCADEEDGDSGNAGSTASPEQVIDLVESVLKSAYNSPMITSLAVTALAKLSERFVAYSQVSDRIKQLMASYTTNIDSDVQQRAFEFCSLYRYGAVKEEVLDRMPPYEERAFTSQTTATDDAPAEQPQSAGTTTASAPTDILSSLIDTGLPTTPAAPVTATTTTAAATSSVDLLADLFGSGPVATPAANPSVSAGGNALDDIFGGGAVMQAAPALQANQKIIYQNNGIMGIVTINHPNNNPALYSAMATFTNSNQSEVTEFVMRVAVPKWLRLELDPASGSVIPAGGNGNLTQLIKLINTSEGANQTLLRVKFTYKIAGSPFDEMVEVSF